MNFGKVYGEDTDIKDEAVRKAIADGLTERVKGQIQLQGSFRISALTARRR